MFYIQYLTSLCERRSWAEPVFDSTSTRQGYIARVRVNNREYTSDEPYPTERLAFEKAAELAYYICYNFSINDGMYPGQRAGQAGVVQGLPVAIGTGRGRTSSSSSSSRRHRGHHHGHHSKSDYVGPNAYAGSTVSRESSPRTSDSDLDHPAPSRRSSASSAASGPTAPVCMCGRGYVIRYSRCGYCLREVGRY